MSWKARIEFPAREAFFLCGRDRLAPDDKGRCAVVVVRGNSENPLSAWHSWPRFHLRAAGSCSIALPFGQTSEY